MPVLRTGPVEITIEIARGVLEQIEFFTTAMDMRTLGPSETLRKPPLGRLRDSRRCASRVCLGNWLSLQFVDPTVETLR